MTVYIGNHKEIAEMQFLGPHSDLWILTLT